LLSFLKHSKSGYVEISVVSLILLMKNLIFLFVFISAFTRQIQAQTVSGARGETFKRRVVARGLSDPWEITYGPDGKLWVTEAKGYRVSKIDVSTGAKTVLLDLTTQRNFPRYDIIPDEIDKGKKWPQGGLMGMALHPQLLKGKPYVYVCYIYNFAGATKDSTGCADNFGGCFYTSRLVRYEYNSKDQKLINPSILCDSIPQSSDHNSGRVTIGRVDGKSYLFYTMGEMGAGQHENAGRINYAQTIDKYEGKVLRFNLEPDGDKDKYDRWIPNDNPFNAKRQSGVWSYGHRNAQGLAFGLVDGVERLYSSEHGPFGDEEVNLLEKGKNYGHPLVIGYNDNNYNGYAAGVSEHKSLPGLWHTTYPLITSENTNAARIGTAYRDPIKAICVISPDSLKSIFARTVANDPKKPEWAAEAPSSIEVYTSKAIPGWANSLLVPTLKNGKLIRLKLQPKGEGIIGDTINYFNSKVRYRDITLSPEGSKIYLATDSSSVTSGPSEENAKDASCKGCIIEFTYQQTRDKNPDLKSKANTRPKRNYSYAPLRAKRED